MALVVDAHARVRDELERVTRLIAAAGIAGVLVGIPAGLLARVIMKVSALTAGSSALGAETENGNIVGAFTADGTIALVIFAGLAPVGAGAILYAAVRPHFRAFARWCGAAFGLYLLALAGPVGLDSANGDFNRFGPAALNVAMFAALFLLVGTALVPVSEVAIAGLGRGRWGLVAVGFPLGLLDVLLVVAVTATTVGSWVGGQPPFLGGVVVTLMFASAVIGIVARRAGVSSLSYAALAVPLAIGLWLTGTAVVQLLR
jgi:hypothetical protein